MQPAYNVFGVSATALSVVLLAKAAYPARAASCSPPACFDSCPSPGCTDLVDGPSMSGVARLVDVAIVESPDTSACC